MAKKQIADTVPPLATAAAEGSTAPLAGKKAAKRKSQLSSGFLVLLGVLGVVGYLIFASMQAFRPARSEGVSRTLATPNIPTLKLNQDNARQGPVIDVDEGTIGKTNPFK
jgi:hypothetical protein